MVLRIPTKRWNKSMIPPKRSDIFLPDCGMLRRSRCVHIFLLKNTDTVLRERAKATLLLYPNPAISTPFFIFIFQLKKKKTFLGFLPFCAAMKAKGGQEEELLCVFYCT